MLCGIGVSIVPFLYMSYFQLIYTVSKHINYLKTSSSHPYSIGVVKFGMTHMSIYRHDTKARWLSVYLSFSLDNLPLSSAMEVEASGSGLITPTTEPSLVAILSNFNLGTPNTSTDAVSDLLPINF